MFNVESDAKVKAEHHMFEFEVRFLVLHVLSAPSHRLLLVRLMLSWERHVVHDFEVVRSVMAYQNQQPVLASRLAAV